MADAATGCEHDGFSVEADIARLTDKSEGAVVGFHASVRIRCQTCGSLFRFVGLTRGLASKGPTVNVDETELRVPIQPPLAVQGAN